MLPFRHFLFSDKIQVNLKKNIDIIFLVPLPDKIPPEYVFSDILCSTFSDFRWALVLPSLVNIDI